MLIYNKSDRNNYNNNSKKKKKESKHFNNEHFEIEIYDDVVVPLATAARDSIK
jgi:hypothetical protein